MSDVKKMVLPFVVGVVVTLVIVYFSGGLHMDSNFKLGTK